MELSKESRPLTLPTDAPDYTNDVSIGIVYAYDADAQTLGLYIASLTAALAQTVPDAVVGMVHIESGRFWQFNAETIQRLVHEPSSFFFEA